MMLSGIVLIAVGTLLLVWEPIKDWKVFSGFSIFPIGVLICILAVL
jgi:hypothetical protein